MNTWRILGVLMLTAALVVIGSAASVSAQPDDSDDENNETGVEVVVASGGVFDAFFCDPTSLVPTEIETNTLTQSTAPTANAAGLAEGQLAICYTDTKSSRPEFDVEISASNFASGPNEIPASGFTIEHTYNIGQFQWDGHNVCDGDGHGVDCGTTILPIVTGDIGDIGYFIDDGQYTAQIPAGNAWTTNNSLEVSRAVHFAWAGIGTVVSAGVIDVALELPAGTLEGTYTSEVTLSVVVGTNP